MALVCTLPEVPSIFTDDGLQSTICALVSHRKVSCRQVADIDLRSMVSAISADEHADCICVASHMSGPPDMIDLQRGTFTPLPSTSPGGP